MYNARTLLIVDGPSAHYSARDLGKNIDYKGLINWATEESNGQLIAAVYFNVNQDNKSVAALKLFDWLIFNGYVCKILPAEDKNDSQTVFRAVSGFLQDIRDFNASASIGRIILFGNDHKYGEPAFNLLKEGIRVSLIGTRKTELPRVGMQLLSCVPEFLELDDLPFLSDPSGPEE